ncbi:MAG: hypothetical protein ABEJ28_12915 [Salinigranum sp.]
MPREEYLDRTTQIYFGTDDDDRLTKEQVGQFIRNKMGLERADDSPQWTEGILELVEVGMDNYEREVQPTDPEILEQLEEAEQRLNDLERENEMLKQQLETQQSTKQVDNPVHQVHLSECRILEVLCREEYLGHRGDPNFVDVITIVEETGMDPSSVTATLNRMSSAHVDLIKSRGDADEVKPLGADLFEEHCEETGIDPAVARRMNQREANNE